METSTQNSPIEPTLYELSSEGTTLTYSTSSIDGTPSLSYASGKQSYMFRGDEIRVADTEIGRMVTVTLEAVPDLQVITLTLLVPLIHLDGGEAEVRTQLITTTHRTSIGGPRLVKGQVASYATAAVAGVARAVHS